MNKKDKTSKESKLNKKIKFLDGRPERNKRINKKDLIDLKISLKTTGDVSDFISSI